MCQKTACQSFETVLIKLCIVLVIQNNESEFLIISTTGFLNSSCNYLKWVDCTYNMFHDRLIVLNKIS